MKRFDLVLRALAEPIAPGIKCVIAGEGAELDRLVKLRSHLELDHRVQFVGRLDEAGLIEHLARCRAVVFPPWNEDYGFVTVEAFMCGKPVITCHDSGGPSELVRDGENGLVTAPNRRSARRGDATGDGRSPGSDADGGVRRATGVGHDLARRDPEAAAAGALTMFTLRGLRRLLRALGVCALVVGALGCGAPTEKETLNARHLETPRFDPPPPPTGTALHQLRSDFTGPGGRSLLAKFVPSQGAALMIALLVMLAVAFDWNRPRHSRNIELLALLPIGFLLFEVMRFFSLFQDPTYWRLMDAVFIGIMFMSVLLPGARAGADEAAASGPVAPESAEAGLDGDDAGAAQPQRDCRTAARTRRCGVLFEPGWPAAARAGDVSVR